MLPGVNVAYAAPLAVNKSLLLNIGPLAYFDTQQMFLNILKQGSTNTTYAFHPWQTSLTGNNGSTGEELYLTTSNVLDADGYLTSLTVAGIPGGQQFQEVQMPVFVNMASTAVGASGIYPAGSYTLGGIGKGTISVRGDATATFTSATNGAWSTTFTVATATTAGLRFVITALPDNVNYLRGLFCVQTSQLTNYQGGAIFHPNFLSALQAAPFSHLRFMDTLATNSQIQGGDANYGFTLTFTAAPTSPNTTLTLSSGWPLAGGTYKFSFSNGQDITATISSFGSTSVSLGTAITSLCANYAWVSMITDWSSRPQTTNASYASIKGCPYEICMALCNLTGAHFWLNVPVSTDSTYWSSLATLCQSTLNSNRKVYPEFTNEAWNTGSAFPSQHFCNMKSIALWGSSDAAGWFGMQTALMADSFATVYGNPGFDTRVAVQMGGQAANTAVVVDALTTPLWSGQTVPWLRTSASGLKTIKGICIAPYFGEGAIATADFTHLTAQGDGGFTDFFASFTANPVNSYSFTDPSGPTTLPASGWFGEAAGWVQNHVTAMVSKGSIPVNCYEGGWQFTANVQTGQKTFLVTAARDARMNSALSTYFQSMVTAGAALPAQYNFCSDYGGFQWGLIESPMQTFTPLSSAPPRLQGAAAYI